MANERSNPAFKLAWTIVILALPIFGSLLYLFGETQPATKWINERLQSMHAYSKKYWKQDKEVLEELEKTNDQVAHLSRYAVSYTHLDVYKRQVSLPCLIDLICKDDSPGFLPGLFFNRYAAKQHSVMSK